MSSVDFDPFAGGEILQVSPTTWPQKEIIASAQMSDEANTAFNEAVSVTIDGDLDVDLMRSSLGALVERHDVFRSTFSRNGSDICLQESRPPNVVVEDVSSLAADEKDRAIQRIWNEIAITPMNLEEGPLVFFWIVKLDSARFELMIAAHHVVCDGWSFGLLLDQLAKIYRAGGDASGLDEAPSFLEFAEELNAREVANEDIDFWKEKFAELPPVVDLPLDKKRPTARPFEAARLDVDLDPDLVAVLPKAAAAMKASLVNVTLSGWFALLHRLTGVEDLVVGLPVAGQAAFDRLGQAGHLVQLLPIRIRVTKDMPFADVVQQVKSAVFDASDHPNFTFAELLKGKVVDRSRVPVMSTIFNIDQPMGELDFGSARGVIRSIPRAAENFEIFLNVRPYKDRLQIEATYSTALFTEPTIASWLGSLEQILAAAVEDSSGTVGDLQLARDLPDDLKTVNATATEIAHPDVTSAFAAQADKTPDATAVSCQGQTLSYADLARFASAVASHLRAQGVSAGDIVAICCRRSVHLQAYMLGILEAGAAYLPLDPGFPDERLRYMLEDSGAKWIIQDDATRGRLSADGVHAFDTDELAKAEATAGDDLVAPGPDDRAYIIYTSGSTGRPKGVCLSHRAMMNFLGGMLDRPGVAPSDRLLAVTTLSFDISVLELFLPLVAGGTVVVATEDECKDGTLLAERFDEERITVMQATPATWRLLLDTDWAQRDLSSFKCLCGGEPLPPDLARDLVSRVGELWNMFGPTETTVWSTCKRIDADDDLITVGTPIANTQIYVLDDNLHPLPLSVGGELFIGGDGLAIGYHERPELTEEKFLDHPRFGRIYRTGDTAKIMPGGETQHLGRVDDQVKIRGYRIELGEIESALKACDGVSAAAAYLWELSPEDVRLVACCIPAAGGSLETMAIRKALRETLPSYMMPQYFVAVDEIPLSPAGKVHRKSLPRPEVRETTILKGASPVTRTEKQIAEVWTELVKPSNPVSREDNFFEIGGHSLLALQAIRKIEGVTGVQLTANDIVVQRLSALAQKIDDSAGVGTDEDSGPVALPSTQDRELSPEQIRLLERQLAHPEGTCNNLPASWVLEGDLDLPSFHKSLKRVYERQTALRTVITRKGDSYHQGIIHADKMPEMELVDCADQEDALADALERAGRFSVEPFVPLDQPLVRATVYRLAEDRHLFVFVPHQLIFDGWSFDLFLGDLQRIYSSFTSGRTSSSTPLDFEFRDYADWLRRRSPDADALAFHRNAIADIGESVLVDANGSKGNSGREVLEFSLEDLRRLEGICETHGFRMHELLMTMFSIAVHRVTDGASTLLGMPVSGRTRPDVISLVGSFVSTLPFEAELRGDSFADVVANLAEQLKRFLDHQDVSYADVVADTDVARYHYPNYITASFGYQDVRNRPTSLADLKLSQIDMPRSQTELPLEFWTRVHKGGVMMAFDYDDGLMSPDTIRRLAAEVKGVTDALQDYDVSFLATKVRSDDGNKPIWRRMFK